MCEGFFSRGYRERSVPLAPVPNMAMLTIKKAKWYQSEIEKMRMIIISKESVEKEQRKIMRNNFIVCVMILHIITRIKRVIPVQG
jgi:hypothetical protein